MIKNCEHDGVRPTQFDFYLLTPDGHWQLIAKPDPSRDRATWYLLTSPVQLIHNDFVQALLEEAESHPAIDIFYTDVMIAGDGGEPTESIIKPAFDPAQIFAQDYIGLPLAIHARAIRRLEHLDPHAGSAQSYELILRAWSSGLVVGRIPKILATMPREDSCNTFSDRLRVVGAHLNRWAPDYQVTSGRLSSTLALTRSIDDPPFVTLIVPTAYKHYADGESGRALQPMVFDLLDSIAQTDWPVDRLQILVGDDDGRSVGGHNSAGPFAVTMVGPMRGSEEPFNYARTANRLWRQARSEYLVFMNDDVVVTDPGWLRALMHFNLDASVGGVGARLLYPDGRIQHAGIAGGYHGVCGHVFIGMASDQPGYQNWAVVHRDVSIVTGAVFATRYSAMALVGGFDERFPLDYNDVDLCLRLRVMGYRIIYTPHAELVHREGATRGRLGPRAIDTALFFERWKIFIKNDPFYPSGALSGF